MYVIRKVTTVTKVFNPSRAGADREMALLRRWLAAETDAAPEQSSGLDGALLYGRFVSWCRTQNITASITHQLFSRRMKALGYLRDKRSGRPVYYGIALRSAHQAQAPPRH